MTDEMVTPKNISELIDHLMKSRDPAVVGLRRILKKKADLGQDFPLQEHTLEEFATDKGTSGRIFNETEQRIMELEKTTLEHKDALAKQKKYSEEAIREAYKKGRKEGLERGEKTAYEKTRSEFDQQIREIEERLRNVFRDIGESRKALLNEAHRNVLDLSSMIAHKIINTELSVNPDIILSVIKKALSYIVDKQKLVLRVAPNDLETVTQKKDFWTSIAERLENITVEQDDRIEKGGCIIESNTGVADARINVQLAELNDVIDSTWENMMTSSVVPEETGSKNPPVESEKSLEEEPEADLNTVPDENTVTEQEENSDGDTESIDSTPKPIEDSEEPAPGQDVQENPGTSG